MSFEEAWELARMPSQREVEHELAAVVAQGGLLSALVKATPGGLAVTVRFAVEDAEQVAARLDDTVDLDYVRDDLDPPREREADDEPADYVVVLDILRAEDDQPPKINLYSNEADNRAAWPVACEIAFALAERLGIAEVRPAVSPHDVPDDQLN